MLSLAHTENIWVPESGSQGATSEWHQTYTNWVLTADTNHQFQGPLYILTFAASPVPQPLGVGASPEGQEHQRALCPFCLYLEAGDEKSPFPASQDQSHAHWCSMGCSSQTTEGSTLLHIDTL